MFDDTYDNTRKIAGSVTTTVGGSDRFRVSFEKKTRPPYADLPERGASGNFILAAANAQSFDGLKPHLERVSLGIGKELYPAGERSDYVYFPETAVVSHLHNLADGNTIEIAMVGADGATGINSLFSSQPMLHQASVSVAGSAQRVKTDVLRREFQRGGKLQTLLLYFFNEYLAQVSQRVACTSFHLTEKRFCSWLLMLHDRARTDRLTLTHERLAQFLGVCRPSLTKIAKTLSEERLINYTRGKFHILDRRGLEAGACECYLSAKTDFQISFR